MAKAEPLKLRLFLEGIEVPVVAANVQIQRGQPAQSSIQIVPTDSALLLLPRTFVSLFFLDSKPNPQDYEPIEETTAEEDVRPRRGPIPDSRYKLLFEGEVIGYNYSKTPTGKSMILQCLDLSSYWDACYQWFADYSVNGDGFTDWSHQFVGANQYLFDNVASGTRWVIGNLLTSSPRTPKYANTKGLLAGYIHLLEAIGGIRPQSNSYPGFRGANDFFSIAELRYKLTGMLGAVEKDTTSARMYRAKAFKNWLKNGMSSAGSLVSFRDIVRLVGQYIYHDVYPNPCAYYQKGSNREVEFVRREPFSRTKLGKASTKKLNELKSLLSEAINAYIDASSSGNISATSADLVVKASSLLKQVKDLSSEAEDTKEKAASIVRLNAAESLLNATLKLKAKHERLVPNKSGLISIPNLVAGEVETKLSEVRVAVSDALKGSSVRGVEPKKYKAFESDFLFSQLIIPETFFVPPPRCNVIFPDQYTQFNYNRNFIREVSRLALNSGFSFGGGGGAPGINKLLGHRYFAPNIRYVENELVRRTAFSAGTNLMPHEVHAGIVPKFEWITDGHRWGLEAAREVNETKKTARISYIQRLANFQFFMHRWSSRTMTVAAKFLPNLVAGFPAVIIDRGSSSPAALEAIADALGSGRNVLPTAYIGKIENLVHNITQKGGETQVALMFARTHRGYDDEFLGVLRRERKDVREEEFTIEFKTIAARLRSGDGVSDFEKRLAQFYFKDSLIPTAQVTPDITVTAVEDEIEEDAVTITRAVAEALGVSSSVFDGYIKPTGRTYFNPFTKETEAKVPEIVKVNTDVRLSGFRFDTPDGAPPPESVLKPGWYSSVWEPVRRRSKRDPTIVGYPISEEVYTPLLGTRSITDDEKIGDAAEFARLMKLAAKDSGSSASISIEREGDSEVLKINEKAVATFDVNTATVEKAIDGLSLLYGLLRKKGVDVGAFVRDYTFRPIASLYDILGDPDLRFDENGDIIPRNSDGTLPREGFHSRAFGDYNTNVEFPTDEKKPKGTNALTLLLKKDQVYLAANLFDTSDRSTKAQVPNYLDPRGRSRERVKAYIAELNVTRGLLGI